jgi:hypothetical protein
VEPEARLERIQDELQSAAGWRRRGKEGRARVCARRAAGWAARMYFQRQRISTRAGMNAYRLLEELTARQDVGLDLRQAAERLITRVTVSGSWPFEEDPIQDAELICARLLAGETPGQARAPREAE